MSYYVYAGGRGKVPYSAGAFPALEDAVAVADAKYDEGYFWVEVRSAQKMVYRHERGFPPISEQESRLVFAPRERLSPLAQGTPAWAKRLAAW